MGNCWQLSLDRDVRNVTVTSSEGTERRKEEEEQGEGVRRSRVILVPYRASVNLLEGVVRKEVTVVVVGIRTPGKSCIVLVYRKRAAGIQEAEKWAIRWEMQFQEAEFINSS